MYQNKTTTNFKIKEQKSQEHRNQKTNHVSNSLNKIVPSRSIIITKNSNKQRQKF